MPGESRGWVGGRFHQEIKKVEKERFWSFPIFQPAKFQQHFRQKSSFFCSQNPNSTLELWRRVTTALMVRAHILSVVEPPEPECHSLSG